MLPLLRLVLAGVFATAGVTKLLDLRGSRQSLTGFGVPETLIPVVAIALPLSELVVALLLLPHATAALGAAGAAVLLAVFIAAISESLRRGRRPDCHCFGQLHSTPIGWPVLARNAALLAIAAVVLIAGWPDGGAGAGEWFFTLAPAVRVLAVAVALGLGAYTTRAVIRARAAANAPLRMDYSTLAVPIGTAVPPFALPSVDGEMVSLESLLALQKPVVLTFIDPECVSCAALLPEVEAWQRDKSDIMTVAVVSRGTPDANRAKMGSHVINRVLLQEAREVATALGILGTPGAIVIGEDGLVASRPAFGAGSVSALVSGVRRSTPQRVPQLHEAATPFALQDLDGQRVALDRFLGGPVLLLFWDAGCTHCQQLLGLMRLWEARPTAERPQLIVVARGEADVNAAQGFRSTVVLDRAFGVATQYGVTGTPSAVLIDGDGRIASDVAAGGQGIMSLIGQPDVPELFMDRSMVEQPSNTPGLAGALLPGAKPMRQDYVDDELLADGSMVLYNASRKEVLTLNPTGALVWEYCDGMHDLDAIVAEVSSVFPSADTAGRDVRAMLDTFLQSGLLTLPSQSPPPATL